jgi:hypothetical protein
VSREVVVGRQRNRHGRIRGDQRASVKLFCRLGASNYDTAGEVLGAIIDRSRSGLENGRRIGTRGAIKHLGS